VQYCSMSGGEFMRSPDGGRKLKHRTKAISFHAGIIQAIDNSLIPTLDCSFSPI
jgi:hypothetical protein